MNQSQLVITQKKSNLWLVVVGSLIISIVVASYFLGRTIAFDDMKSTKEQLSQYEVVIAKTKAALEEASESLVMQQQSSKIDGHSNLALIDSVKKVQQEKIELEKELKFYRKILAPELDKDGLEIESFIISRTVKSQEFNFRLTLIQAGKQLNFLKGEVVLRLSGFLNGKKTEFNFLELGTFNSKHFQFKFKYFQNIQGLIVLPSGFEVKGVNVLAKTKARKKNQKSEKQMLWQPQEGQSHVR